jgi:hypothetical protein
VKTSQNRVHNAHANSPVHPHSMNVNGICRAGTIYMRRTVRWGRVGIETLVFSRKFFRRESHWGSYAWGYI